MENLENTLSEKESLLLIEKMINSAKSNFKDKSFYFLFWGWLVFAAAVSEYLLLLINNPYHYLVWPILMPMGGIIAGVYGFIQRRKTLVKTYTDQFMSYLWTAFLISMVMVIVFMNKVGYMSAFPIIIILYGIGTFVSGGAMKFKPLIYGGVICWIIAGISFFVSYTDQLLLLSLSLLVAYIIPGHMLKAYKNGRI